MDFKIYIEDPDELQALDVVIHNTDGTVEMHRIYSAPELTVIDGGELQ